MNGDIITQALSFALDSTAEKIAVRKYGGKNRLRWNYEQKTPADFC